MLQAQSGVYVLRRRYGRRVWIRIGGAFPRDDGQIELRLDCMPGDGRMRICRTDPRIRAGQETIIDDD